MKLAASRCLLLLFCLCPTALMGQGTAFTYQGHLTGPTGPVNAVYDFQFYLYSVQSNGIPISTFVVNNVLVTNGLFATAIDFGNNFDGNPRWLEISNVTMHVVFPRQPITATPYAVYATTAGSITGGIAGSAMRTSIGGSLAKQDPSYFADIFHATIANPSTFPKADYPGQMLMTYDPSIGGDSAGQLWFAGADYSWRRGLQLGWTTIYANEPGLLQALLVKSGNGIDNPLAVQNVDPAHFSAMRWVDTAGYERGAIGYGNDLTPFYRNINYMEDDGLNHGFYFTATGSVIGGMDRTNGDLVWFSGASTSPTNALQGLTTILRLSRSNATLTVPNLNAGNLSVSNKIVSTPAGGFHSTNFMMMTVGTNTVYIPVMQQ